MTQHKQDPKKRDEEQLPKGRPAPPDAPQPSRRMPKPESSSEYEGAKTREPTGNSGNEVKTETSSTSGQ